MSLRNNDAQRNQDAVCYVGNLDERADDGLLWELMLQAGPVVRVHIPRDRVTGQHNAFGFAEFQTPADADYAVSIMNGVKLFGRALRVNKASADKKDVDIGANLFVRNLDPDADERDLLDAFAAFGNIVNLQVARDDDSKSKGYAFISFDSFESSDAAKEAMQNQYLRNRPLTIDYAIKKDGKHGEKHGTDAERLVAAQARKHIPASVPAAFATAPTPSGQGFFPPPPPPPPSRMPRGPSGPPPPPPGMPVAYGPPASQAGPYGTYPGSAPPPPPGVPVYGAQGGWQPPPPPPRKVGGYMTGANSAPLGPR